MDHSSNPLRNLALPIAIVLLTCGGDEEWKTSPRLLDRLCRSGACVLTGTARLTTGLTSDTLGVRIGPGVGKFSFPVPQDDYDGPPNSVTTAFVKGQGTVWRIEQSPDGGIAALPEQVFLEGYQAITIAVLPTDPSLFPQTLTIETRDDSSDIHVVDIERSHSELGCDP